MSASAGVTLGSIRRRLGIERRRAPTSLVDDVSPIVRERIEDGTAERAETCGSWRPRRDCEQRSLRHCARRAAVVVGDRRPHVASAEDAVGQSQRERVGIFVISPWRTRPPSSDTPVARTHPTPTPLELRSTGM